MRLSCLTAYGVTGSTQTPPLSVVPSPSTGMSSLLRGLRLPEFSGIFGGVAEAAWIPLSALRDLSADAPADPLLHAGLQVVVRLRPGVADATSKAEIHTLARSFALAQKNDQLNSWDLNLYDSSHMRRDFSAQSAKFCPCCSALRAY